MNEEFVCKVLTPRVPDVSMCSFGPRCCRAWSRVDFVATDFEGAGRTCLNAALITFIAHQKTVAAWQACLGCRSQAAHRSHVAIELTLSTLMAALVLEGLAERGKGKLNSDPSKTGVWESKKGCEKFAPPKIQNI